MREIFSMWKNTRMVVLAAVSAAIYVAVLLPFKIAQLVPGLTEFRPGAAMPVLLSFLFGPAAAWGSAFGNLIADLLGGMFGPGSIPGFIGNFLLGYIPYKLWAALSGDKEPLPKSLGAWAIFLFVIVVSSLSCAFFVGWGVDSLKLAPFALLANIIALNDILASVILVSVLIHLIYPRTAKWGLGYREIMDPADMGKGRLRIVGALLVIASAGAGFAGGNLLSFGMLAQQPGTHTLMGSLAPLAAALLAGCALL